MRARARSPRSVIFCEAAGALLFFGVFAQNKGLIDAGERAVKELESRGYQVAAPGESVRVYPAQPGAFADLASHAGHWSAGVITLREAPESRVPVAAYLRHELMHQANYRSCRSPLPPWADEAAAMAFSGELAQDEALAPSPEGLALLRRQVQVGAPLTPLSSQALRALLTQHGWPAVPCALNEDVQRAVEGTHRKDGGLAFRLIHLASARVMAAGGNQRDEFPPGSLLKLPFAAALPPAELTALGAELARSDTEALANRVGALSFDTLPVLLGRGRAELQERAARPDELLGARGVDGLFPLQFSLPQLALVLRAALLMAPDNLRGLEENGTLPKSTLYGAEGLPVLEELHAAAKTGTVSDSAGNPFLGTLAVWWPAEAPRWLAVFRQNGVRGKGVLAAAAPYLKEWAARFPLRYSSVRVAVLGQFPLDAAALTSPCPVLPADSAGRRRNTCGVWRVTTGLPKAQPVRYLRGIIEERDGARVLETDPLSYGEAVLRREGDELRGEARNALLAVIVFNGTSGALRHPDRRALCDTTHCMVFQGGPEPRRNESAPGKDAFPETALLEWLTARSRHREAWFPFSKGGADQWRRELSAARAAELTNEPSVLDLERLRNREGRVQIVVHYADHQETVSCDLFTTRFDLPSCPDAITSRAPAGWLITGTGAGHGEGLQVVRAAALAKEGKSALQILEDAYGGQ